jgi:hypothetical protein
MALARCENHPSRGRTKAYVTTRLPIGYPSSAVICGRPDCAENAKIYLTQEEENNYQLGQRIFSYDSNVAKVMVQ